MPSPLPPPNSSAASAAAASLISSLLPNGGGSGSGSPEGDLHRQLGSPLAASTGPSPASLLGNGGSPSVAQAVAAAAAVSGSGGGSPSLGGSGGGNVANLPQALHNLQRLLQSQLANVNPLHLQQAIQRQQVSHVLDIEFATGNIFTARAFLLSK